MALIDDVTGMRVSTKEGEITPEYYSWFKKAFNLLIAVQQSGTTANRPTTYIWIGRVYYDTTLNKPVYASAVSGVTVTWRDAAGTIV